MPESSHEVKITPGGSFPCRMSPLREFSQSQALPLTVRRNSCMPATFCMEVNVPECLSYINQELSSLGLLPVWNQSTEGSELNAVAALNSMYDLIQLHRRDLRTLEDMEVEHLKSSSNADFLQLSNSRLKDQLEVSKRENTVLIERQRQLQLKVKSLQNCLKNEKEEVQKLQNIIASRASQYNHDMKRKEREFNKLKERLNQLLMDKKEKKQAIEVLNYIGRADGKRSLWKTGKTEAKHEGEMYRSLLSDYDSRQRELLMENAELSKVLQQMKRDMVSILSSKRSTPKGGKRGDGPVQADLEEEEEEEVFDSGKESMELSCMAAREKLTHSIRLQWRRLKSHVERLDSQASNMDTIPREAHEQEIDRLKLEIQQCKDFIHNQQQLLQQQLSAPCDEETASVLNDCYVLEEKERLKKDCSTLEEQRKSFEKERRTFTEAAIRLSHERKAFEEDRATWLKHQFLNLTPFANSKKPLLSKSNSALSIPGSEAGDMSSPEKPNKHKSEPHATFSTPRFPVVTTSSAADPHCTIHLIPENSLSTSKPKRRSSCTQESRFPPHGDLPVQFGQGSAGEHHRSHTLRGEEEKSSV